MVIKWLLEEKWSYLCEIKLWKIGQIHKSLNNSPCVLLFISTGSNDHGLTFGHVMFWPKVTHENGIVTGIKQ